MTRDELLTLIRTDEGVREAIRDAAVVHWTTETIDVSILPHDELLDAAMEGADDRTSLMLSMMGEMMSDGVVGDEDSTPAAEVHGDPRPWVHDHIGMWHYFPDGHYRDASCGHPPISGTPLVLLDILDCQADVCDTCFAAAEKR